MSTDERHNPEERASATPSSPMPTEPAAAGASSGPARPHRGTRRTRGKIDNKPLKTKGDFDDLDYRQPRSRSAGVASRPGTAPSVAREKTPGHPAPTAARARADARDHAKANGSGAAPSTPSLKQRAEHLRTWVATHPRRCVALVALLIALVALYGPTRDYYVARRTGEVLQLKYDRILSKNEALASDVNRLQTREGIEEEARRLGYTSKGTDAADSGEHDDASTGQDVPSQTADPSAPMTYPDGRSWYVQALDLVFCYDPEATWNA